MLDSSFAFFVWGSSRRFDSVMTQWMSSQNLLHFHQPGYNNIIVVGHFIFSNHWCYACKGARKLFQLLFYFIYFLNWIGGRSGGHLFCCLISRCAACLREGFPWSPATLQLFSAFPAGVFPFWVLVSAALTPFRGCFSVASPADIRCSSIDSNMAGVHSFLVVLRHGRYME